MAGGGPRPIGGIGASAICGNATRDPAAPYLAQGFFLTLHRRSGRRLRKDATGRYRVARRACGRSTGQCRLRTDHISARRSSVISDCRASSRISNEFTSNTTAVTRKNRYAPAPGKIIGSGISRRQQANLTPDALAVRRTRLRQNKAHRLTPALCSTCDRRTGTLCLTVT